MRRAEVRRLLQQAANGGCTWEQDVKTMDAAPEVAELRLKAAAFPNETPPVLLRFFFAEPSEEPTTLLGLHAHVKNVYEQDFRQQQTAAVREADRRRIHWTCGWPGHV